MLNLRDVNVIDGKADRSCHSGGTRVLSDFTNSVKAVHHATSAQDVHRLKIHNR